MRRYCFLIPCVLLSCIQRQPADSTLFELKDGAIGISFSNILTYTEDFNPYVYRNFYNGGGVALGDINNDGLLDLYFTGNLVNNKLYLNKGNWVFEDITEKAGVSCPSVWSTGATFVDVNADGLLDLYVCKSGKPGGTNRHNELFINNGDLTFVEKSKDYGLNITGLSVQAAFFDHDKDGDLDCYLLNNSIKSVGGFDLIKDQRTLPDPSGQGNKFLENRNGHFVDATTEKGIYSSAIGFGLGITLGDFNNDQWTDIYISNDFFERDYLYINDRQGGFSEELESYFSSISMGAMGADFADLDNDLLPDLMVTEMLPTTEARQKTKTVFESWDKQQLAKKRGYFNQFSRNTLQKNLGSQGFIDLGRQAQVAATEWSWSALFFDADNDGLRDIFVSNGIYKDLLDRDYLTYQANDNIIRKRLNSDQKDVIKKLIDAMHSKALPNRAYKNLGGFNFKPSHSKWGLSQPSFSNGSVYGDLDNDGDLDLIVNNVNMPSFIYENKTDTLKNRSLTLAFEQDNGNTRGIGARVRIKYQDGKVQLAENYNARGFQSSTAAQIHFGVGDASQIDSLWVVWPNDKLRLLTNIKTNQKLTLIRKSGTAIPAKAPMIPHRDQTLNPMEPLFSFAHQENPFIDFNRERLLVQMNSNEGPAYARTDLNADGVPDFYLGGAKHQAGTLFLSNNSGYYSIQGPFEGQKQSEDTHAVFFDGDGDGDQDLYVCHGGKAFSNHSAELHDTYYENDQGNFNQAKVQPVFPYPINSSVAVPLDIDQDGDWDLFLGERFTTTTYGEPTSGFLLVNNGKGQFEVTRPEPFVQMGMITAAATTDINGDGWPDLIVAGEWMPLKIFLNTNGAFMDVTAQWNLEDTKGLWSALKLSDVDGDGDTDIIAGNLGTNTFFEPNMRLFIADFDGNGFKEQLICKKTEKGYYPIIDKDELLSQIPSLKKRLVYYKDYARANMTAIFGEKAIANAYHSDIEMLESAIFLNSGTSFEKHKLPFQVQSAPIYAIECADVDNDGRNELILGGNQFLVKPKFGSYDGSRGWIIFGSDFLNPERIEPLNVHGQIRALDWLETKTLVVALNNDETLFFEPKE